MRQPELLVPAGDMEKLRVALDYGADAVYAGAERFGLRASAGNFDREHLAAAVALVRQRGKRLYLTLNAYLHPAETEDFAALLEELRPLDIDAYIVADPGALALVRRIDPERPVHLSTQASTTNAPAAQFWQAAGVSRVNLARELTLEEIRAVAADTDVEVEVFVHGALCVAYSGRCLLSAALAGRSANKGACAHPCRWSYRLVEETRPGEYLPVEEDGRGTYIMNSRDLCLIEHLPELVEAGVDSLKIEGRMKSLYYVAAVTRVYRAALDAYLADPAGYRFAPAWRRELDRVSHRPYGKGFLSGGADPQVSRDDSRYLRTHDFVGVVRDIRDDGSAVVEGRNRFFAGETLELIGPRMRQAEFRPDILRSEEGGTLAAGQPNARIVMDLPADARPGDLLRREKDGEGQF